MVKGLNEQNLKGKMRLGHSFMNSLPYLAFKYSWPCVDPEKNLENVPTSLIDHINFFFKISLYLWGWDSSRCTCNLFWGKYTLSLQSLFHFVKLVLKHLNLPNKY